MISLKTNWFQKVRPFGINHPSKEAAYEIGIEDLRKGADSDILLYIIIFSVLGFVIAIMFFSFKVLAYFLLTIGGAIAGVINLQLWQITLFAVVGLTIAVKRYRQTLD